MRKPLVSVLMPSYQYAAYIPIAIESVLTQTMSDLELIIVDDASVDRSTEIIRSYGAKDRRVRAIFHSVNMGVARTMNDALAAAAGEFVAFFSSDDIWVPHKLERQLAVLETDENLIVWADALVVDASGTPTGRLFTERYHAAHRQKSGNIFADLLIGNYICGQTVMAKRSSVHAVSWDERLRYLNDYKVMLALAWKYNFHFTPEPLAMYRVHGRNLIMSDRPGWRRDEEALSRDLFAEYAEEPGLTRKARQRVFLMRVRGLISEGNRADAARFMARAIAARPVDVQNAYHGARLMQLPDLVVVGLEVLLEEGPLVLALKACRKAVATCKRWIAVRVERLLAWCLCRNERLYSLLVALWSLVSPYHRHLMRLPIEWLDETADSLSKVLAPAVVGLSYGPSICGAQDVEQVLLPEVRMHHFANASVCADSSSIIVDGKIILERHSPSNGGGADYSCGYIHAHSARWCYVRSQKTSRIETGMFLGGNGSANYYHFMIEILPKLQFLGDLAAEYQQYPLLVNEDSYETRSFREALDCIAKNHPIVVLDKRTTYRVENLVYINAPSTCPINRRRDSHLKVSDFAMRPSSILFLRNSLAAGIQLESQRGSKRIFLARRGGNRNYNQEEILEACEGRGFAKVWLEDLSLEEQATVVASAETIVGPTGGAWTNLIFCREGTHCLCWLPEEGKNFAAYSTIAKILGISFRCLTYASGARSTSECASFSYHLNVDETMRAIDTVLRDT